MVSELRQSCIYSCQKFHEHTRGAIFFARYVCMSMVSELRQSCIYSCQSSMNIPEVLFSLQGIYACRSPWISSKRFLHRFHDTGYTHGDNNYTIDVDSVIDCFRITPNTPLSIKLALIIMMKPSRKVSCPERAGHQCCCDCQCTDQRVRAKGQSSLNHYDASHTLRIFCV